MKQHHKSHRWHHQSHLLLSECCLLKLICEEMFLAGAVRLWAFSMPSSSAELMCPPFVLAWLLQQQQLFLLEAQRGGGSQCQIPELWCTSLWEGQVDRLLMWKFKLRRLCTIRLTSLAFFQRSPADLLNRCGSWLPHFSQKCCLGCECSHWEIHEYGHKNTGDLHSIWICQMSSSK